MRGTLAELKTVIGGSICLNRALRTSSFLIPRPAAGPRPGGAVCRSVRAVRRDEERRGGCAGGGRAERVRACAGPVHVSAVTSVAALDSTQIAVSFGPLCRMPLQPLSFQNGDVDNRPLVSKDLQTLLCSTIRRCANPCG